jgi:Flp pilus assembly secretin CpaC
MRTIIAFVAALGVTLVPGDLPAQTQTQAPAQETSQATAKKPSIPLRVQVVISRFQGEKKISSVPYTLSVNAAAAPFTGRPSQLRMGSRVPIMSANAANEKSFTYQDIGTQIDCSATSMEDGRFDLTILIEDSSIYVDDEVVKGVSKGTEPPIFRQFRTNNQVILQDGQSMQFTAATDRINGEVIRVDVTLNVVK